MKKAPDSGPIWSAWLAGGVLAGQRARPHGRVTVEPGFYLNTTQTAGDFLWGPVRWWQRADNSQQELEVPNIISIDHEYSIDSDAGTCTVVMANTKMDPFGTVTNAGSSDLGQPGYYTPDRGGHTNRWNYAKNSWYGILGVNALLRTYEGYGGQGLSIKDAVAAGNLVLTGVWLVDDVALKAPDATLTLQCRSMAKLLIDQEVFPPLIPTRIYPITFYADNVEENIDPVVIYGHLASPARKVVGIEGNGLDDGYWLVGSDGGVYPYGNTRFWGHPVGILPSETFLKYADGTAVRPDVAIGMAATDSAVAGDTEEGAQPAAGYWVCTNNGLIYCQPAGTMVRVANVRERSHGTNSAYAGGCHCPECTEAKRVYAKDFRSGVRLGYAKSLGYTEVPIEQVTVGDRVVSYDQHSRILHKMGSAVTGISTLRYSGPLVRVETDAGLVSRYTPDHHCLVMIGDAFDDHQHVVYMMRRGSQYRIGRCAWRYASQNRTNGPVTRCHTEGGDAFWVLSVHDSLQEAHLAEALAGYEYSIPTWTFRTAEYGGKTDLVGRDIFWGKVGDNSKAAGRCLTSYGRHIDAPLWEDQLQRSARDMWNSPIVTRACNLMTGMRVLPADGTSEHQRKDFGHRKSWVSATVTTEWYDGDIVSMSVERDHTYVADGIVTHNSYGDAQYHGGMTLNQVTCNVVAVERMGSDGYIIVDEKGNVFTFGTAVYHGGSPGLVAGAKIVGVACTPFGLGYYMCDDSGRVYTYGNAVYYGGGGSANPVVGMNVSASGHGYYLVATDGGVFCFGDAAFYGSYPSTTQKIAVTGIINTQPGNTHITLSTVLDPIADLNAPISGPDIAYGATLATVPGVDSATLSDVALATGSTTITVQRAVTLSSASMTIAVDTVDVPADHFVPSDAGAAISGTYIVAGTTILNYITPRRIQLSQPVIGTTTTGTIVFRRPVVITGVNTTAGSLNLNLTNVFLSIEVGGSITGPNIPASTTVSSLVSPAEIVLSNPATAYSDQKLNTVSIDTGLHQALNDIATDIAVANDGLGYWIGAEDGGVFAYSPVVRVQNGIKVYATQFYGSMPGAFTFIYPGNYHDFLDIVRDFLLWSGFYFFDNGATDSVYGNLETTGTHSTDIIDVTTFDKKPVIDVMNTIKAIVGYNFYIGDEGEAHFEEPNWWQSGNTLPDGTRSNYIPVLDERVQIATYSRSTPDKDIRSQIIVSSEDPYPDTGGGPVPGTVTSRYPGPGQSMAQVEKLKGLVRPAMWVNQLFVNADEQNIMAQLIALHIYFKSQLGTVDMLANPMLQIDDQVQILERQGFEINYHYVRTIRSRMDLKTGEYVQTLTTNILSPPDGPWAVTKPTGSATGTKSIARVIL